MLIFLILLHIINKHTHVMGNVVVVWLKKPPWQYLGMKGFTMPIYFLITFKDMLGQAKDSWMSLIPHGHA